MKTKIPSPSRSQGAHTPRRKTRRTLSVGSPALSTASGRLTSVVQGFVNTQMNSFALSPLPKRRSVLTDNTDIIEEPRRKSWWKNLDENSRNVLDILEDNNIEQPNNIMEELDIEILSQEKKNYTLDIPESSDGESIHSIVLPQRKLFTQKETQHQKTFGHIIGTRETMKKSDKSMIMNDKVVNAGTKELFQNKPRSKLLFPAALLDITPDKTIAEKTRDFAAELKTQPRNIFGNRQGAKRKNMFADFIATESEDEISDIEPRVFGFPKKPELIRQASSASRDNRKSSATSNITTDTEMDEWRLLPSSTMVEHQLEAMMEQNTPKRPRLSKLTETKESSGTHTVFSKAESPEVNTSVLTRSRLRALNNSGTSTVGGKNKTHEKMDQNQSKKNNQHDQSREYKSRNKTNESSKNFKQNEDQHLTNADKSQGKMNKSKGKQNKTSQKTNVSLAIGSEQDEDQSQEVVDGIQTVNVVLEANKSQGPIDEEQDQQSQVIVNLENNKQKVIAESQEIDESNEVNVGKEIDENKEVGVTEQKKDKYQDHKSENKANESQAADHSLPEIDEINEVETDKKIVQTVDNINENNKAADESSEIDDQSQKEDAVKEPNEVDENNEVQNESQEDDLNEAVEEVNDAAEEEDEVQNESQLPVEDDENETIEHDDNTQEEVDESNVVNESQEDDDNEAIEEEDEVQNESQLAVEDDENTQEEVDESNIEQNESQENNENEAVEADEVQNESQLAIEDDENTQEEVDESNIEQNESQEEDENETVEGEDEEQNESQLAVEDDEITQEEVDESNVEQNESQEADENEDVENENQDDDQAVDDNESENAELHYESASEEMEVDDEQDDTPIDQEIANTPDPADQEYNISHDTTGRNRHKHTPEAILHEETKQTDSFSARRNTSVRKTKSMVNLLNGKPSLMPARDSTGFTDGTTNSSAEGSGWDSHRTTRKTIRKTFGKDATPRKSLRALVMEKSAKRQTLASETAKFPLANSTAVPEISLGYFDIEPVHQESTHEVSLRTRQLTLDAVLEKIKEDNLKKKAEIQERVKQSLETHRDDHIFKVPHRPMFPKRRTKENKTSKVKSMWQGLPEEMIEALQYKPPKRFKPSNAPWITKRLYKHLETKLEPKYDYKARVRAEKLVETMYNFTKDLRRQSVASEDATNVLKHEMARLRIVRTHHDFYEFFRLFMPKEIRIKVIPDVVNKIPLPRCDVFSDIVVADSAQG